MKSKSFIYGLFAAIALAGCSSDDAVVQGVTDATISDGNPHYLAVTISNTGDGTGSSAKAADYTRGTDGGYEAGEGDENTIHNVRFYFFNEDGTMAKVKKSGSTYVNYLDWTSPSDNTGFTSTTNVSKQTEATLVIETPEGDKIPTKMMAVVNLTDDMKSSTAWTGDKGLSAVRNIAENYLTYTERATPYFVMASSVYLDATKERVSTSTIESENIKETADDAKANPVALYVERNVAKVKVLAKSSDNYNDGVFKLQESYTDGTGEGAVEKTRDLSLSVEDENGNTTTYDAVYFKVGGWNLAATTNKAYLSKHVSTTWNFTSWTGWNDYNNKRSYWGCNYIENDKDAAGWDYKYSYNNLTSDGKSLGAYVYANENAATSLETGADRTWPTQVVIAGTLQDADGNALSIGEYAGLYYTEAGLKQQLANKLQLYYDNNGVREQLPASYLTLVSVTDGKTLTTGEGAQDQDGRCYVKLKTTYSGNLYATSGDEAKALSATEIQEALDACGTALFYDNGQTYYWFKVQHLADKDRGEYGLVRNHVYNCTISNVYGLGTPVKNPDETIYPETPIAKNTYIAAQINVLSWHIVNSNIDLGK